MPYSWSNGPGDRYGWHTHGYTKVLYCVSGSIVFHTREGDVELTPGDRLEVDPGTEHAASVGWTAWSASKPPRTEAATARRIEAAGSGQQVARRGLLDRAQRNGEDDVLTMHRDEVVLGDFMVAVQRLHRRFSQRHELALGGVEQV